MHLPLPPRAPWLPCGALEGERWVRGGDVPALADALPGLDKAHALRAKVVDARLRVHAMRPDISSIVVPDVPNEALSALLDLLLRVLREGEQMPLDELSLCIGGRKGLRQQCGPRWGDFSNLPLR